MKRRAGPNRISQRRRWLDFAEIAILIKRMAKVHQLESGAEEALGQIRKYRYYAALLEDGRVDIRAYGIAFHKKRCFAKAEKLKF